MNRLNNVQLCRSCLSPIFNGFNIFETLYQIKITTNQIQTEIQVSEIFEQFTGINLDENDTNISKYLCLTCLERLASAYEFYKLCKISDDELKSVNINVTVTKYVDQILLDHHDVVDDHRSISDNDDIEPYSNDVRDDPDFEDIDDSKSTLEEDERISKSIKVYDCLKCNKVFNSSADLKRHERVHEGNWSCNECDKTLSTKYTFRHHMMLHVGKPFECKVCQWRFSRMSDLNRHTRIYHLRGKYYGCDECPKRFYIKSHLTSHRLSHLNKKHKNTNIGNCMNDIQLIDDIVNKVSYNEHSLHLTDENNTIIKCETESNSIIQTMQIEEIRNFPFKISVEPDPIEEPQKNEKEQNPFRVDTIPKYFRCKKCFKKFRQRNNYLRHLKSISNCQDDLKCRTNPQKCQYCAIILDNVSDLRKHLELHLDQEPFRCKICNKNYKTWLKLAVHSRQMHLMKKKYQNNHLCTVCGRGLPSAKLLEDHYFVHQGIRNYKCECCDRAFYTKGGLKQHSAIHTRDVLQCSECGKILADKMTLQNHLTIHFGKKFKCTICEKLFPNVSTLNRHVKVHRGERNYQCDRCSKRYMRRGHLNDHIKKVHDDPKTMACEECGLEFNHRGSLNKHRRLEHAEKPFYKCNECGKSFGRKSRLTEHHKKFHTLLGSEIM